MSKATWADVKKHDVIELDGREYRVVKIKAKGKKAAVMVERKGSYFDSVEKLKDRVKIVTKNGGSKKGPLTDADGNGQRWATKKEAEEVLGKGGATIPRGDSTVTKPPSKPGKDPWTDPKPGVETMLGDLLNARLVGETKNEAAGFYVPPVDVSTVASHLTLFHGGIPERMDDEGAMLIMHEAQHAEAKKTGAPLAVNHWHTKTRP